MGTEVLISTYETSVQSETVEYHITIQQLPLHCLSDVQARARVPSILFFDEIDSYLVGSDGK